MAAEAAGYPTVSIVTTGFIGQARAYARALGVRDLRIVELPGVPMTEDPATLREKVLDHLVEPLVAALLARQVP